MDDQPLTDLQEALRNSQTSEWKYLAEGGAHLVFAYRGSSSLLDNKVLRIRKENIASSSTNSSEADGKFETARQYFGTSVTPALVPASLLPIECRLTVDAKWVQQLEQASLNVRPQPRLSTPQSSVIGGDIKLDGDRVIEVSLVENLLGGEGDLAIEIKVCCTNPLVAVFESSCFGPFNLNLVITLPRYSQSVGSFQIHSTSAPPRNR